MSAGHFRPPGSPPSMLSGLTHELRTPLNSILMMAELLVESLEGDEDRAPKERELRYARNIAHAVRDVLELVDHAGELGRIEAGRTPPAGKAVAISELARRIEDLARPGEPDDGPGAGDGEGVGVSEPTVALNVRVEPDAPPEVATDPARLLRTVELLLSSAFRVSGEDPVEVRLGAPPAGGPEGSAPGSALRITVTDSGPPCSGGEADRLFVPFGGPDPRTVRRHGGTGLGLSVAWALARLLEGTLTAEPAPDGRGCRFVLTVPALAS